MNWAVVRRLTLLAACVAGTGAFAFPAHRSGFASAALRSDTTIRLVTDSSGSRFEPATITIAAGTTVTFTWASGFHNVVSSSSPGFESSLKLVSSPNSYSVTFTKPGTYVYFCSAHGTPDAGMRGTVVVQ
jgi:plastocyanin